MFVYVFAFAFVLHYGNEAVKSKAMRKSLPENTLCKHINGRIIIQIKGQPFIMLMQFSFSHKGEIFAPYVWKTKGEILH